MKKESGMDFGQLFSMAGGIKNMIDSNPDLLNNIKGMLGGAQYNNRRVPISRRSHGGGDKGLELLAAIKPMVSEDRTKIIDMICQLYLISKILR